MSRVEWVRTNRRAPVSNWRSADAARVQGPWHIQNPIGSLTLCGSEVSRIVSSSSMVTESAESPPDGRVCAVCLKWFPTGRSKPTTSRGRRQ